MFVLNLSLTLHSGVIKKVVNKIETIQLKFTRLIFNRCNISNISYKERLTKLGLKSLEDRRWEFDLITLFIIINGKHKVFFDQFFSFYQKSYVLRGNNKKITCKHNFKNSQWQNSLFHRTMILWNKLPKDVVSCERVEHILSKLKKVFLSSIIVSKIQ